MSRDRVTEAYRGGLGETDKRMSQDRVNWTCSAVEGERVLDLGCSQGIVSILLGREGFEVVGVDLDQKTVEYARQTLAAEPKRVRERVTFEHGTSSDIEDDGFDTVVLGDVLENQAVPSRLLNEIWRVLREGGKLVLTTPFGLVNLDSPRQTFYVDDLLHTIGPWFEGESLTIQGDYLHYTGRRRPSVDAELGLEVLRGELDGDRLLDEQRKALEDRERDRIADLHGAQTGQAAAKRQAGLAEQARRRLEARLAKLQEAVAKGNRRVEEFKSRSRRFESRADTLRAQLKRAHRDYQDLVESNRYLFGEAIWRALRDPRAAAKLPLEIGKIAASTVAKRLDRSEPAAAGSKTLRSTATSVLGVKRAPTSTAGAISRTSSGEVGHPIVVGRSQKPTDPRELWVATILDEMSEACFRPECNLITFRPDNWRDVLEERPPHFLFVESAWHGNGGSWQYKIGRYNHPSATGLSELLEWCRGHKIPTVFWNKEDPVHFDKFKDAARQFDYVFTTDAAAIPRYRALEDSRIQHVGALLFAAQPRLHNPVWAGPRASEPVFAGSYYGTRHHERRAQQEELLDVARRFDLVIYDRNWGTQDSAFWFPERFEQHIHGRLPYEDLSRVYRQHRVFLNVNSVIDSPTMLSRRVFELLACGTAMVSTPSRALEEIFGDLVPTVESSREAEQILEKLLTDDEHWRDLTERGIRFVLSKHTYRHRLAQIAATLGFGDAANPHERIAAFATSTDLDEVGVIVDTITRQTVPVSELILGLGSEIDPIEVEEIAARAPDLTLRLQRQLTPSDPRERARELAKQSDSDWLWAIDPRRPGDPNQLADLAGCLVFTRADVIGASAPSRSDSEDLHRYTTQVDPRGALVRRLVVAERGWDFEPDAQLPRSWVGEGLRFYCARRPQVAVPRGQQLGESG